MSDLVKWELADLKPGQRGVQMIRHGEQTLVAEMHTCDEWELVAGSYRCGLTFGDGQRCDLARPERGRSWSTRTYAHPAGGESGRSA